MKIIIKSCGDDALGRLSKKRFGEVWIRFSTHAGKIAAVVALVSLMLLALESSQPLLAGSQLGYEWGSKTAAGTWIDMHIQPAEIDLKSEILRTYWFQLGIYALDNRSFDSVVLWPVEWHESAGLPPKANETFDWTSFQRTAFWELTTRPPTGAEPWGWQLLRSGEYPWDSYSLRLVFAFNRTMNLSRVTSYVSLNPSLSDQWKVLQDFVPLGNTLSDQTLISLGFSHVDINSYLTGTGGNLPLTIRSTRDVYELRVTFVRQAFDILRGALALWTPAIFLASLLVVAFGRLSVLDTGEALTVFLGTGLAALPLVFGALQILPPRISLVESIFYAEIGASILFATIVVAKRPKADSHKDPRPMMNEMQTIMFDTNEFDKLTAARDAHERLLVLLSERKMELLVTHIQRDEIVAIEDSTKKAQLLDLLGRARMTPTRGAVWGVSGYGQSTYGSDEDHKLIAHIRGDRWDRDTNDALIAATAARDADVFVTDDETLVRRLKSYTGIRCEVINFEELERRLVNA
jgi:hypothetical protein